MVRNAKEGFDRVLADEDGNFAFIHEASQVNEMSCYSIHFKIYEIPVILG